MKPVYSAGPLLASLAVAAAVMVAPGTPPTALRAPAAVPAAGAKACSVGSGVTAKQVVVVRAAGSRATVRACRRVSAGRYVVALGPYSGHVGRNGVASKGAKREGDGRTPSGVFALRGGFGVKKDPGVRFSWRRVDSHDVWVDDSSSRYYNLHKRSPARGRWSSAERLKVSPAYDYAQVVGYNEKRTPGRGSAIFLHVDQGRGTAGCVSLPRAQLLKILRWEKPGAVMSIKKKAPPATATSLVAARTTLARPAYFSTSRKATRADLGSSWRAGCPVGASRLRVVTLRYWGFDNRAHTGTLVVNKSIVKDTRTAFGRLYAAKFAIHRMVTVDHYGGSDTRSMKADNTSAFNCRRAVQKGPPVWSKHAYGLAIDINTVENPYILDGKVMPKAGRAFVNRAQHHKGLIHAGGRTVRVFASLGFRWGGVWSDPDYQHFDRA